MNPVLKIFRLAKLTLKKNSAARAAISVEEDIMNFVSRNNLIQFDHPSDEEGILTPPDDDAIEKQAEDNRNRVASMIKSSSTLPLSGGLGFDGELDDGKGFHFKAKTFDTTHEDSFPKHPCQQHGLLIARFRAYADLIGQKAGRDGLLKEIKQEIVQTKEGVDGEKGIGLSLDMTSARIATYTRLMKQYGLTSYLP